MSQTNSAQILISRIVVSPEAMFDLQSEMHLPGGIGWVERDSYGVGLAREAVFGLPIEVDPRLIGQAVRIEIDA